MQKTMSEVRKVAEAIGWSAETLQRAWEAAGIAIAVDAPPLPPWRAAYADWMKGREHDVLREEDVWKAAVDWCVGQINFYAASPPHGGIATKVAIRRRITGDDA